MEKEISKPEGRATFRFGSTKTICQLGFPLGQQSFATRTSGIAFR